MPGGPGCQDFLADMHAAWQEHGREAIDRVIAERPEAFLAVVARTIDVRRVELGRPGEFQQALSKEEIVQRLEEQSGPAARKLFEEFVARIEELDRDQQAEWMGQRLRGGNQNERTASIRMRIRRGRADGGRA
jgi:hypothetical protein